MIMKRRSIYRSKFSLSNCLNWKFTVMIILHFHLQTQFKYEFFHVYFSLRASSPFGSHARFILGEIYLGLARDLGESREGIGAGARYAPKLVQCLVSNREGLGTSL